MHTVLPESKRTLIFIHYCLPIRSQHSQLSIRFGILAHLEAYRCIMQQYALM